MALYGSDPAPRDISEEGRETLGSQIELAGPQYEAIAKYRPLYDLLNLGSANRAWYGTGGEGGLRSLFGDVAATASGAERASQAAQREADIGAVETLGPRATAALRGVNPQNTALLDALTSSAQSDVEAGYDLPPGLRSSVGQSVRAGQAARGLGFGPADAYQETLSQSDAANRWRTQNRQQAMGVAQLNAAIQGDPFQAILGRPSQTGASLGLLGSAGNLGGASGAAVGGMFDPFSSYGADVYNTNFNAKAASALNTDNAIFGLGSSALSAI